MTSKFASNNTKDNEQRKFKPDSDGDTAVNILGNQLVEMAVLTNLKTLELKGISLDDYICADDEIVALSDGSLVKADF